MLKYHLEINVVVPSPCPVTIKELLPMEDYVKQAVEAALEIHTSDAKGDILVFLTGKSDIEEGTTCIPTFA